MHFFRVDKVFMSIPYHSVLCVHGRPNRAWRVKSTTCP